MKPMEVALLNPPFSDPMIPPPALAAVAENLASHADVIVHDLNLDTYNALFDLVLCPSTPGNGENRSGTARFGGRIREAFGAVPSLLGLKQIENDVLDTVSALTGNHYRFGRCFLAPSRLWPETALEDHLENFSRSCFGHALEGSIAGVLPEVMRAECVLISVTFDSQCIPALMTTRVLRDAGYGGAIALGGIVPSWMQEYLATTRPARELLNAVYTGELPLDSRDVLDSLRVFTKGMKRTRGIAPALLHAGQGNGRGRVSHPTELASNGDGYNFLPLRDYWGAEPLICMAMSKGCYYGRCNFCAYGYTRNCAYLCNQPCEAAERVLSFREKLGVSVLCLETDVVDPRNLTGLARELKKAGSNVTWHAAARFEPALTLHDLEVLFEGGCRRLYFGLESGSPRVLSLMHKGIELSVVKRILRWCTEVGIAVELGVLFGFPGEREEEARETLRFLAEHTEYVHRFDPSVFRCMRNSRVAMNPRDFGMRIKGPAGNWYTLCLESSDLDAGCASDPVDFARVTRSLKPESMLLDIAEDIWLTCRYGVKSVDSQVRDHADGAASEPAAEGRLGSDASGASEGRGVHGSPA